MAVLLMRILKSLLTVMLVSSSVPAFAVPFANGDFSSGMTGWNGTISPGTVLVLGGEAQLATGAGSDPYSAVLVQGDDGSFMFPSPITLDSNDQFLNFDVSFLDLGIDGSESGGSLNTDALTIAMYDALDFNYDKLFAPGIDITLGSGWTQFSIDISSLAGRDVALSFELADENDGRDSRVKIDNVTFTGAVVQNAPEPASVLLLALGIMLMVVTTKHYGLPGISAKPGKLIV